MLLKTPIGALIYKTALEPVRALLDIRKAKYTARLLGLLKAYPTTQLFLVILRYRDVYAQPREQPLDN
jgi:hypothetical protein